MTRREREITDFNEIKRILDQCMVIHIGLVDDGMPYVLPMNYGYEMIDNMLVIYVHGSTVGYKNEVIKNNPDCCFEMECNVIPFEGDVACRYGTAYESVMGRGRIEKLEDTQEKIHGLKVLMKTQTSKDFDFTEKLVSVVNVFRINVSELTAKRRPKPETCEMADKH